MKLRIGKHAVDWDDFSASLRTVVSSGCDGLSEVDQMDSQDEMVEEIRKHCCIDVIFTMERSAFSGDEEEVFGIVRAKTESWMLLFVATNFSETCELLARKPDEALADLFIRFFDENGWNICQFSGTTIRNRRPDLLSRASLGRIIDHVIDHHRMGWDAVDSGGVTNTEEFLKASYSE